MTETHTPEGATGRLPPEREEATIPEELWVLDPAVKPDKTRVHEMLNDDGGKSNYEFAYQKRRKVPTGHALKFLDSGFSVSLDEDGERPLSPARNAKEGHDGQLVSMLRDDEVIANVDELTRDALLKRATGLPGGQRFAKGSPKKEELAEFITAFIRDQNETRRQIQEANVEGGVSVNEQQRINVYGDVDALQNDSGPRVSGLVA